MEISPEKFKRIIAFFVKTIRDFDAELQAHRLVLRFVEHESGVDLHPNLELARSSPELRAVVEERNAYGEKLLEAIDRAAEDRELEELLKRWNPKGPSN